MKHAILLASCLGFMGSAANAEPYPAHVDPPTSGVLAELGTALPDTALSDQRGKATISNKNEVDGALYRNQATNTVSGGNFVTEGALSDSTGLFTVIQNSGNNVLIQNATILNLDVR